ncbi:MAG: efflux RND transporter periplasmic adaptor subunit [Helicobacteraceae bacterium]|jgi:RND family efflux transporter MFP subunit|nr:efflux RND transporter periplasmic adaptor subunit [Helicobacteraceae bacterium]
MFLLKSVAAVTAISVAILFSGCGEEKKPVVPNALPPLTVETVTVYKKHFPIWLQYTGMTKASSDQEIRARVSGRLQKIYFKDGDMVKKGEKLFLIEQSEYKSNLESAKAKKRRDEASLQLAKADVQRYNPLVKDGLAPRATLEQYEAKHGELVAAIAGDEAAVQNAALELSYTVVTAPISGQVSARRVDVGNLVGYGESAVLTTIVQTDSIYTYFSPTESEVQRIYKFRSQKYLPAFIEVRGQGEDVLKRKRLDGYVDFANNTVDPLTSTISMRATIDNKENAVYAGTFVYINIFLTDQYDFIMIPPQSIFEDQLGKFVYTVDDNNTAQRTSIKTNLSSRYYTSVSEGLSEGDKVVISGLMKVKEGRVLAPKDRTETKGVTAVMKANNLIPEEVKK